MAVGCNVVCGTMATVTGDLVPASVAQVAVSDVEAGLHPGLQVYASVNGIPIVDFGVGEAQPGLAMHSDTAVPWLSATKPLCAIAVARLREARLLAFSDRVAEYIPEFAAEGKGDVTLTHLLTHTVPFARDIPMVSLQDWDGAVRDACALPLQRGAQVGRTVRYTAFASWHVLGEIVQRLTGEPVSDHIARTIFSPLGMSRSRISGETRDGTAPARELSQLIDRRRGRSGLFELGYAALRDDVAVPGVGGSGPMRELGRIYEAFVLGGELLAEIGLSESTAAEMTQPHRVRLHDAYYGAAVDWGLGFIADRRIFAGARLSRNSFGHDGRLCAVSFADPDAKVVICVMANALVDPRQNNRRMRNLIDLSLDLAGIPRGRRIGGEMGTSASTVASTVQGEDS